MAWRQIDGNIWQNTDTLEYEFHESDPNLNALGNLIGSEWWEQPTVVRSPGSSDSYGTVTNPTTGQVERLGEVFGPGGVQVGILPESEAAQYQTDPSAGVLYENQGNKGSIWDDLAPYLMLGGFGAGHLLSGAGSLSALDAAQFGTAAAPVSVGGGGSLAGLLQATAPTAVGGWSSGMQGADAIEALINMTEAAGTTATPAAASFGFPSMEAALASINPAWAAVPAAAAGASLAAPALPPPTPPVPPPGITPMQALSGAGTVATLANSLGGAESDSAQFGIPVDGINPDTGAQIGDWSGVQIPGGTEGWGSLPSWLQKIIGSPEMLGAGLGALTGGMGGSKQSGTITTVDDIPEWLKPYASNLVGKADRAFNESSAESPISGAADDEYLKTLRGGYAPTEQFNQYRGMTTPRAENPYIGRTTNVGTNPYAGVDNPYMNSVLDRSLGEAGSRVNTLFSKNPNNFGSAGHAELLAKTLGDVGASYRYKDYQDQQQLAEADIARRLGAEQTDLARNSSLAQNLSQFNSGLFANDAARNANIWNADATRNQAAREAERNRQVGAATTAPSYLSGRTASRFAPYNQYKGILSGWGSSESKPLYENNMANILGGGLAGYSFGKLFGSR